MTDEKKVIDYSHIKRINHNQTIAVGFGPNYSQKTFNLYCPFIPDLIKVTAFTNHDTDFNNIYEVKSNLFNSEILALFSPNNSFIPTYEYTNQNRQNINGLYTLDCFVSSTNVGATDINVYLKFEYIRWNID